MGKRWEEFKNNFPWKDMVMGFLIPKAIFFIGIRGNMLFPGAFAATAWCLAVFWMTHARARKVNIFAIFAVIMILARIIVVLASRSPALYMFAQAIDSAIYGAAFLASLLFPRSMIQLFAEASGAKIPEAVRGSPYYKRGWKLVTAVWGAAYVLMAVMLVALRSCSMSLAAIIDMLAGWPIMIVLIVFTMQFTKWYWARKIEGVPM